MMTTFPAPKRDQIQNQCWMIKLAPEGKLTYYQIYLAKRFWRVTMSQPDKKDTPTTVAMLGLKFLGTGVPLLIEGPS